MPVSVVTPVLATGFLRLFAPATAPATTEQAARDWAKAYVDYIVAGGIPDAKSREAVFGNALAAAFPPELAGTGPSIFVQAFQVFWIGLTVPAQSGVVTAFIPVTADVNSPQPAGASPADQARGLAQVISGFTLGSVIVTVPPGVTVPLL